jgi:CIC family chloride channel protein
MGTAFAGVVRAPMTSVVMIFEITRDYAVIVPLMISNLVSYFISSRLQREPIYEQLAEQDGIHLPQAEIRRRERQRQVGQVMSPATDFLDAGESVQAAREKAAASAHQTWLVRDPSGVIGILTREQLQKASVNSGSSKKVGDLLEDCEFPHLHTDQSFDLALARMGSARTDMLPVVSRANVHELLGVVRFHDVLESYGLSNRSES